MQEYTKKKLRDIKLARYREADDKLSKDGPVLIAGGNSPAYARKSLKLYTIAIENIVNDIFECETHALSSLGEVPDEQYLSELKEDIINITDRELHMSDVKLQQKLAPYTRVANFQTMQDKSGLFHGLISRKAEQLKEELLLTKKRSDNEAASITNNTVNNYGSIDTLSQGQIVSNKQDKTTIHNQRTGWPKIIALISAVLGFLIIIFKFVLWLVQTPTT